MSRKHYRAIAKALSEERKYRGDSVTFDDAIRVLTRVLKADNPNFDKEKFLEACK